MKFDKSKVYTALNADELYAGDTVYVADSWGVLRTRVENEDVYHLFKIETINSDFCNCRFDVGYKSDFAFAYLVKKVTDEVKELREKVICLLDEYLDIYITTDEADKWIDSIQKIAKELEK